MYNVKTRIPADRTTLEILVAKNKHKRKDLHNEEWSDLSNDVTQSATSSEVSTATVHFNNATN